MQYLSSGTKLDRQILADLSFFCCMYSNIFSLLWFGQQNSTTETIKSSSIPSRVEQKSQKFVVYSFLASCIAFSE